MYFLHHQQQQGFIFIKFLRGVNITMFQKINKIISVIKICHFVRSVLADFIFVCLFVIIYLLCCYHQEHVQTQISVTYTPIERQTGVTVLQSELFTLLG